MGHILLSILAQVIFFSTMSLTSHSSTFFIGNGGEVVKIGKHFYLRDLVESNIHHSPYFNCSSQKGDDATKIYSAIIEELSLNKELLSLKLCNLAEIRPEFSEVFTEAINQFSWVLVDEELGGLELQEDIFKFPKDSKKTLANRTLNQIRIQRQIWNTLNPENKIALVFHEVIYSLLKPECADTLCHRQQQSPRIARELTSLLFMKESFSPNRRLLIEKQLLRLLNIQLSSTPAAAEALSISLLIDDQRADYVKKSIEDSQTLFLQKVCMMAFKNQKPGQNRTLSLSLLKRGKIHIEKVAFQSEYNLEYFLKASYGDSFLIIKKAEVPSNSDSCPQELLNLLEIL